MKKILVTLALLCFAAAASADPYGNSGYQGSSLRASNVKTTSFDGTCAGTDTVQECLDELDDAAGGAPTNVNYLVGTASGDLSAEIAVGTTPGGELGGSWASPTIDDTLTVDGWTLTNVTISSGNATVTTITGTNGTLTGTATIPNGTGPTVAGAGNIAVDTTADQLKYYGGAVRVLSRFKTECKVIEDPADADDNIPLFIWPEASTITDVSCNATGSSTPNIAIVLGDGTNSLESITCDDDGATDDGSITNATFTAEEPVEIDFGAPSGTVDWCTVCVTRTVDAS